MSSLPSNCSLIPRTTALCCQLLKKLGVTHVLNAACGKDKSLSLINTSQNFYREAGIKFLGVEAYDITGFHLYPFFEEAAEFIHEAIQRQGKPIAQGLESRLNVNFNSSSLSVSLLLICRKSVCSLSSRYLTISDTCTCISYHEARPYSTGSSSRSSKSTGDNT